MVGVNVKDTWKSDKIGNLTSQPINEYGDILKRVQYSCRDKKIMMALQYHHYHQTLFLEAYTHKNTWQNNKKLDVHGVAESV